MIKSCNKSFFKTSLILKKRPDTRQTLLRANNNDNDYDYGYDYDYDL